MNAQSSGLTGVYYDGHHPIGVAATIEFVGAAAIVLGPDWSQRYARSQLRVTPRTGRADRFISFPDGAQLQCPDGSLLDALPQPRSEGVIAWLEARVAVAVTGIALVIGMVATGYLLGLPALADYVASRTPIEAERALGEQSLTWLDQQSWFRPSKLDTATQAEVRADFDSLRQVVPGGENYRLEFRNAGVFGPNAFALPGGTVVITDAMVQLAQTRGEVTAVLAHEIGHLQRHHTLRLLLQSSAVAAVAATLTGDAATLSLTIAGLPAVLAQAKYSREFESEADTFAFDLLRRTGRSPADFANIMERLSAKTEGSSRNSFAFFSSHPLSAERIQRAREAAQADTAQPEPAVSK